MKKSRQQMIGAYYNGRSKGGITLYGFSERKVTTRELPSGERKVIRHPLKSCSIKVDSDGYFEFQDIPENIEFIKKLIMPSKKSGKRMAELDDADLQEKLTGQAQEELVSEVQLEEVIVETESTHVKFQGESTKKELSPAKQAAIEKMLAGKKAKEEAKKAKQEQSE